MLRNTFSHIPDIGEVTERTLWQQGCLTWADLAGRLDEVSVGAADRLQVRDHLERSEAALTSGEHQYFARRLGLKEAWRAFPEFRDRCVYLDIETDGGQGADSVTIIGLYDGREYTGLVKGRDLGNFRDRISHYSMIVTFFGASFDLPVLARCFRDLRFDQIHLDLCPTLRRVGFRGGLKKIEKQVGLARGEDTDGLTGFDAVKLWSRHAKLGDERALDTLIAYNREDVVNLERLAEIAYAKLREATFEAPLRATAPAVAN